MFIQTELSPNPNAIKFIPGVVVKSGDPVYMTSDDEHCNTLAKKFFSLEEVSAIFFGSDFITITKKDDANWEYLKPQVIMILTDHLLAGLAIFDYKTQDLPELDTDNLSETEMAIVEIIETRVRPAVARDGGDIIYRGFKDGVVFVELRGACSGCPSSSITLRHGIESMLQHYVPEVKSIEAVNV